MVRLPILLVALSLSLQAAGAQQVDNGVVRVRALGKPGAYTGFAVASGDGEVARVLFSTHGAMTARAAKAAGTAIRFGPLVGTPTPKLGPGSHVKVTLLPGSPYPKVSFHLDLQRFDRAAWEKRMGRVPFHFLACSLPGAEVFHQRGWIIGTPVVDDYIQRKAQGPGRTVVSSWSRDWTYAPPIGAYPTAIAGLWNPSKRRYVGYDFHGARLTDHSEKHFGTSYCYKQGAHREFFCLTWPYGRGYINLRYPEAPVRCGTHFRLLWSREIGPEDDPNEFVHQFLWQTYARLLPDSERMNDLSWLPNEFRISDFGAPGPLGDFVQNTGPDGSRWWEPNVNLVTGVGYFSPIDYYYDTGDQASIAKLGQESRRILPLGKWMEIAGDRCFFWQTPLDGGGMKAFGPGVETFRHVQGWYAGLALLDYCRNDPEAAREILPYVDGVLRYTKHILYTRNCYPDVPAAQFAWSATPAVTFCLRYYYHYRSDPERRELAELARKLARSLTYRYLAIWPCDNDEMDDLDSSFLMEPNAGLPWLACACANEIWVYNIAMLYEYVATGDPIIGHYLRGMLERTHELFQDQWFPRVQDYGVAFTERLGLFAECAQGKGARADFGGLWGGFERLIWPLGSARVRVVCGEKAAMAFNRDGRHTDIADYRYYGDGRCSFTLAPIGPDDGAPFDVTVTFPFFRLADQEISLRRGGETQVLGEDRILRYSPEPSTITIRGVRPGDVIGVGHHDERVPVLSCRVIKPRTGEGVPAVPGFRMLSLPANASIRRDWNDVKSLAGYEPGVKTLYGVPFRLLDPEPGRPVAVKGQPIPVKARPQHLFLLVDGLNKASRVTLRRGAQAEETVDLRAAIPALKGWPPVLGWHIDLVAIENRGRPVESLLPRNCRVFAVTTSDRKPAALAPTLAALKERRAQLLAEEEMVRSVVALGPLFTPFSGHVGILPAPDVTNPRSHPVVKMLMKAGLMKHLVLLSKEDLVNPAVFNARRIWIAFYVGGENYYQTVSRQGDGDEALVRWLKEGGTLVSLSGGPFPFYYNEAGKAVVSAPKFGLPVCGSGAHNRLDRLARAAVAGWEKPPSGVKLTFHVSPTQKVIAGLPKSIPWLEKADPRWRPVANVVGPGNTYTPIITLKDQKGKSYGEAAAMIEYRRGNLAGGRVLYVWHSLRTAPAYERTLLTGILRYLLKNTMRPVSEYACLRAGTPPVIDGDLSDPVWRQAPATEAFLRFGPDRGKGRTFRTTAKLAWDDQALYLAWECEDPDIWSTLRQRDGNLWEQEVVEAFIDPDGDGKEYAVFEINPLGTVVDLKIPRAVQGAPQDLEGARRWNASGWRSAVRVEGTTGRRDDQDRRWTVETAIPLTSLPGARRLPPRVGDVWRLQLFRIDRSKPLPAPQFSAWSATDTFHNPARFGRLVFAANPAADDFNAYAPGKPPVPTWTITGGEWQVREGALVGRNSGTDGWAPTGATAGSQAWKDYRLSLRFQVRQTGGDHRDGAWIGFRYTAPGECYSLNFGSVAQLHKASRGQATGDSTPLAQAPWANDRQWHQAVITVRGSHITVELDGRPLLEAVDEDALGVPTVPAGGICLSARRWSNSPNDTVVAFDDVEVQPE